MEATKVPFMANTNFSAIPHLLNHAGDGNEGWCQVPPSSMPWGIPMENQPTVVRFTAGPSTSLVKSCDYIKYGDFFHTKRKLEDDMDSLRSHKQLITEEKMAARLSEIHISSNFAVQQPAANTPETKEGEFADFKPKMEGENLKRLVISEEMKNIKCEPIIPASLLTKLEKPSMALVLWQPPSGPVLKHLRSEQRFASKESISSQGVVKMEDEEEEQSQIASLHPSQVFNNNNTLALDLNSMDTGFSQVCRPSGGVDEMEC